jgi:hypothetical protein
MIKNSNQLHRDLLKIAATLENPTIDIALPDGGDYE